MTTKTEELVKRARAVDDLLGGSVLYSELADHIEQQHALIDELVGALEGLMEGYKLLAESSSVGFIEHPSTRYSVASAALKRTQEQEPRPQILCHGCGKTFQWVINGYCKDCTGAQEQGQ